MIEELKARIAELDQKLYDSLDAERDANMRIADLEHRQAVMVGVLKQIEHSMAQARVLGNDVRKEVHKTGKLARAALAAAKPAGQKGGDRG
jgi:uncharacterized coiled-coil protein SlyX